ncbi:hypothetical protein [Saccharopolyspora spinosa]|uniref:Uncharacterized protein n=1 Tax=Saccharopolyspora spinosa TaxID=60894 RepID=A0A2N3XSK1_SACSN|nr:hypothetical protein [Saccharopolyspora spinosa]PKW13668.1 hypothetical protein A8926_1216 [Saccharopolyspora spinosa]
MDYVVYGPSIECERLEQLHDFLSPRGWQPDGTFDKNEPGYILGPETCWEYEGSFESEAFHRLDDVTPAPLECRFSFTDWGSADGVRVDSFGAYRGCGEHDIRAIFVPDGEHFYERLAEVLDAEERRARAADVRALMECRVFGACGVAFAS